MLAARITSPAVVIQFWCCLDMTVPQIFLLLLVPMLFPRSSPSLTSSFCTVLTLFLLPVGVKMPDLPSKNLVLCLEQPSALASSVLL